MIRNSPGQNLPQRQNGEGQVNVKWKITQKHEIPLYSGPGSYLGMSEGKSMRGSGRR